MSKGRKENVLIIDNSLGITGAFKAILNVSEALSEDFNFTYCLNKNSGLNKLFNKSKFYEFNFIELQKSWKILLYFPFLIYNSFKIVSIVKKLNIKIIHINDIYNMTGILVKLLCPHINLVYHIRLMPNSYAKRFYLVWFHLINKYSDSIICVSKAVLYGLPKKSKVKIIYDYVNENTLSISRQQKDYINLLYFSNYIPGKGQDLALTAFNEAYLHNPRLKIKFVGGDFGKKKNILFKEHLKRRATELGLSKAVSIYGHSDDPYTEYLETDIFLNFSESESFSMTCLEALACGTPIIVSDCGGPSELFIHRESGLLVPNKDVNAMKTAILELAENEFLRKKFEINSRAFVVKNFSKSQQINHFRETYNKLLSQKNA